LSMAVIAVTAGGFTQVMSFSVPEMLELDPEPVLAAPGVVELELQAALNTAMASARDPASAGLAHLCTDMRIPPLAYYLDGRALDGRAPRLALPQISGTWPAATRRSSTSAHVAWMSAAPMMVEVGATCSARPGMAMDASP
jgi:hypothetical protein